MKSVIGILSVWGLFSQTCGSPLWGPVYIYQRPIDAMVDVTNDLGIAVLQDHVTSRGNFAFSPYGVASVLVLLYEGARGESARQIHNVMRFPWQRDITRIGYRDIHRHLKTYFSHEGYLSGITLSKVNTSLLPEYQRVLRFYGYDVSLGNPSKPKPTTPASNTTAPTNMTTAMPGNTTEITTNANTTDAGNMTTPMPGNLTSANTTDMANMTTTMHGDLTMATETTMTANTTETANVTTTTPMPSATTIPAETTTGANTTDTDNMTTPIPSATTIPAETTMDANTTDTANMTTPMPSATTIPAETTTDANTTDTTNMMTSTPSVTTIPAETSTPSATTIPAETSTPSATTIPAETSTPSATTIPAETSTNSATTIPAETSTPSVTTIPAETSTPSATTIPAETPTPSATTIPAETSTPSATTIPAETTTGANPTDVTMGLVETTTDTAGQDSVGVTEALVLTTSPQNITQTTTSARNSAQMKMSTVAKDANLVSTTTKSPRRPNDKLRPVLKRNNGTQPADRLESRVDNDVELSTAHEETTLSFVSSDDSNEGSTMPSVTIGENNEGSTLPPAAGEEGSERSTLPSLIVEEFSERSTPSVTIEKNNEESTLSIVADETDSRGNTLPSVTIGENNEGSTLPSVTVEEGGKGSTLPHVSVEEGSEESTLPSVTVEESGKATTLPLVGVKEGSEGSTLPTVGVEDGSEGNTLPTVGVEEGSEGSTLPAAVVEVGSEGSTLPTVGVEEGSEQMTDHGVSTVPTESYQEATPATDDPSETTLDTTDVTTMTSPEDVSSTEAPQPSSIMAETIVDTSTGNTSEPEAVSRTKRVIRDPANLSYPDISLQLQNGMYGSHVSRGEPALSQLPRYPFLVDGVTDELVPVMSYTAVFPFAFIPRLHSVALEFPLDDERYKLLIILPVERRGLKQLIYDMSSCPLRDVYEALQPTRVSAVIPSFMVEGFVILTSTLQQLGIWDVFDPRRSDLSGMSSDPELFVRNIEQSITVVIRNYVEIVDIQTRTMAARSKTERFEATHPFLYFVMDTETHVALMAGKIIDPLNSRIY